jgi:hypothetical protein
MVIEAGLPVGIYFILKSFIDPNWALLLAGIPA